MRTVVLMAFLFCGVVACPKLNAAELHETGYSFQDKSTQIKANLRQGKYMMSKGNYAGAKTKFQAVLSLDRNNAEAKKLLAQCEAKIKPSSSTTRPSTQNTPNTQNTLSVSKTYLSVSSSGESLTLNVSSNTSWSISVQPASWVHLTKYSNSLSLRIDKNNSSSSRTDYFVIKAGDKTQRVNIEQKGATATTYLTLSKYSVSFFSGGGTETITVNCNGNWQIKTNPYPWGHLSRYGNTLTLRVDPNTSTNERKDYIVIQCGNIEKRVDIIQTGRNSYSPSYNSDYNYNYRSDSRYNNYYKENWWKNRFMFGWNTFHLDYLDDIMSVGTGLRFRFGRWSDPVNLLFGAEYSYLMYLDEDADYYWDDSAIYTIAHFIEVPVGLRFNLFKSGRYSKFYIGCNASFGFNVSEGNYFNVNKNTLAIEPQLGFASKSLDFGIYYKRYMEDKGLFEYTENYNQRIGCFLTWFF